MIFLQKKHFLFLTILCIYFYSFYWSTFADRIDTIEIIQNKQNIFSKNVTRTLLKYEKEGKISLEFRSSENISLKKEPDAYRLYIAPWIHNATWSLSIHLWKKNIQIPVTIQLPKKSATDFNILWDMYQIHLQERSLSCEASATADIVSTLLARNIKEIDIIEMLPKSDFYNKLPTKNSGQIIWGDPQEWFVWYIQNDWDIQAKQKLMTWYGVYEQPISEVYRNFGFKTEILTQGVQSNEFTQNQHLSYLLKNIQDGNMVQLWGDWCTQEKYDDGILLSKSLLNLTEAKNGISAKNSCYNIDEERTLKWQYKNANWELIYHTWLDGEHAFILLWWKGDIDNPTHIRVWDTDTGYHMYPVSEWMRKWEKMQYRSIVIQKL
jgi:hypothetical protein